jgi:hypothetical protein
MTEQQLLIAAVREADRIIAEYHLEAGARDADETIAKLIALLDRQAGVVLPSGPARRARLRPYPRRAGFRDHG